ncbi:MAG: hypothetical protein KKD59_09245, partial [Acidobacteria bacterium]|nr:hypothetical protein [Acidobacteriota bacterium]
MKLAYFPGCTLKNHAKNFEDSALCALNKLGVEVEELHRWNCCGTVFSLATDDLIHHVAPVRNMIRAKELNTDKLMTMCAMCYNTLKRSNERMKKDAESLDIINDLMYEEEVKYKGDVEVLHLLEVLRDGIHFTAVSEKIKTPLQGLKVASYYGCLLSRPPEVVAFDDAEHPTCMDELVKATGAEAVDWPFKTECCGASQMMIADNSDFAGAVWENYAVEKNWVLTGENGKKTVYAKFKDTAGNISNPV